MQMLNWANRFNICSFLDNHQYHSNHHTVECLAAADAVEVFSPATQILTAFSSFLAKQQDWLLGHICYDLKNEIEGLQSAHPDFIGFPILLFYRPETVLQLTGTELVISCLHSNPFQVFDDILAINEGQPVTGNTSIQTKPRISKEDYLSIIRQLQQHILRGDCYEINFCQEFFAEQVEVSPLALYSKLTTVSPNPFACFYKLHDKYLLCASPERYLQKKGNTLLSQPIKGTVKRDLQNSTTDEALMYQLHQSKKDRSENVMVVDLVRNDLSRVCKEGTVTVEELFGVYRFPQVHQMISTIKGELRDGMNLADVLKASFPMGSMTGAPKKRVLELIEQFERTKRGLYSGAVGYIDPKGDYDFNVVIRSLLYNASAKYLNYQVGGGITFYSDAEKEYEECLLKATAIRQLLS
jgi:para-aminobenzoate synthetase component 1